MKKLFIVLSYLAFLMLDTQFTQAQCVNGVCRMPYTPVRNVLSTAVQAVPNVVQAALPDRALYAPVASCVPNCDMSVCQCTQSQATTTTHTESMVVTKRVRYTPLRNVVQRIRSR
jgi:hypothetical protein